jgi:PAS domain S-box-containing protein
MSERCTILDCPTTDQDTLRSSKVENRELQAAVQQYDKLLQSLPDAIVMVGRAGKIVHVNAQLERMFGYTKEELLGKNLEILMPERFRARHRKNVMDFLSSPRIRPMGTGLALFGLNKDGAEFPVDISLSLLTIDGEVLAMAAIRNITEHKNAQRKIELNYQIQKAISSVLKISLEPVSLDEQLSRVLDLILAIPGLSLRSRGSIYLVEKEPERLVLKAMHGFSVAQVTSCQTVPFDSAPSGEPASPCPIIDTGCLDRHHEIQYAEAGTYGQYCVPIVFGSKFLGLINVAVADRHQQVPEEKEFLSAIAASLAGIIERYQSETEKGRLREQLAESEKFAALGRITANVSHTIRNPLTAIGGFANRLLDKLPEGTKERKYARLIFEAATRLENVLQNVLLFSRRDADRREACNLNEMVEKALTMYEDICREKSISIQRSSPRDIPSIDGSKEQVLQALENIISNAVDAMPGGGTLFVGTDLEEVGGLLYATMKVKDTGHGIKKEDLSKIYEPFFSTKLLMKGTGLGLSITKKVMEDHGGFIRVDSVVNAGTTFSLYFPLPRK